MFLMDRNSSPSPSLLGMFNTLRHEVMSNGSFNWIEDMNSRGESKFQVLARELMSQVEPQLNPSENDLDDDLWVMLDSMADENEHPCNVSLDPEEWAALELRLLDLSIANYDYAQPVFH
ncbi:hypothetical protein [Neptuniibacter sp. QD37_11]|uniref:hypothetical protein n=1 Tax=Neptuniibacter sp. QD37_11 TaxID=3398209 RepID=UPI0039F4FCE8